MGLYDFTFYDLICRNALIHGESICWYEVDDGRSLTFAQYKEQVGRLAHGLTHAGIGKGERIGVVGKNSLEFFLLYGASACLGAIVLPVNWRLSAEEIAFNLTDGKPAVVFADAEFQEKMENRREEFSSVDIFYNLKEDQGSFTPFAGLLRDETQAEPADVAATDGFVIIHTAAVAGRPRGALLSHANMMLANLQFCLAMEITSRDVHLNLLPLFHVGGLFLASAVFHGGGKNVNVSKFEPTAAALLVEEERVSLLFDFPPILDSLLKAATQEKRDTTSLRAVIGLGTAEVIELYQQQTGGSYYVMYGQTETSCLVSIGKYDDCPGSAGQVIALGDVQLVDEHDRQVGVGQVGEICLRGPMVFQGYWGLDQDNEYTFRDNWHHTGDLGRFDEKGYLFYAGRKAEKELIKPGGENVYPAEVEKVILQHPAVEQTVVFGVPDPKWKEGIKAVCLCREGMDLDATELIRFVGERIASFKKPQYVEFVDEMAHTAEGEIDREEIKRRYGSAP